MNDQGLGCGDTYRKADGGEVHNRLVDPDRTYNDD